MNKIRILLLFLLLATLAALGQTSDEKKYLLTSNTNLFNFSTLSFLDPYLSPITYNGLGLGYSSDSRRFLNEKDTQYSTLSKFRFGVGIALNPKLTSDILYVGANYGYGIEYRFNIAKGFKLQLGGLWDVDFGLKNLERNINNPVNLDMATNLNLIGLATYNIPLRRKTLKLKLSLQTPLIGYMFVPKSGASYYEMFELGNLTDAFHFSTLHNKRGLLGTFSIDVPFNRSVWNFGLRMNNLRYMANNLIFNRSEYSLVIGTTFDVINFAGRKNKAPKNFISPND